MNIYLVFILAVLLCSYLLDTIVDILNLRAMSPALPKEFEDWYDGEKYKKSQLYLRETTLFDIISSTVFTCITIGFILLGGFNAVDVFARGFGFGSILTGLLFIGVLLFASSLLNIPFSAYATFVIEEKFGFNKTTVRTFVTDLLKSWLLTLIIGGIVLCLVLWFFEKTGTWAWLYCWGAVTVFQAFFLFIYPVVILPLFNKFTPMEDGDLKTAITQYADSQNFRIKGIFTMDGSRRSTKSNAFFTGFGKFKRIALFDTLIEKHSLDELVSIVAHEIGHYKKHHILQHLLIAAATSGIMFFILSLFLNNRALFDAFRMQETSIYASLLFFGFLYTPIEMIISVVTSVLSRKNEFEADGFAASTTGKADAMITALKKLSVDNLSNLTPHPLKVFLAYSHPPVLSRIEKIRDRSASAHDKNRR